MKDLSHLNKSEGFTPDPEPWLAPLLAEAWAETVDDKDKAFAVEGTKVRHSWAGFCARRLAYEINKVEPTEPLSVADYWRFGTGTVLHERWQAVIADLFPHGEIEKKIHIPQIPSSGHVDLFLPAGPDDGDVSTAVELKTINGFGFKSSIGARGAAEGPRMSAIMQGALNAYGCDADEMKIVYLSLENLSPRELAKIGKEEWRRFSAEWTFTKDQWLPIAEKEIARLATAVRFAEEGKLPPRAIPDDDIPKGARITDPGKGSWMLTSKDGDVLQAGSTWHCAYCSFRSRCIADGAS